MATAPEGGAARSLSQREQDTQKMMLAADVHLGTKNCDFQMERNVYKRRSDGIYTINSKTKNWEKLQLAAAIENPQDIIAQSPRPSIQRAVLKFAKHTGAHAIAGTGRRTPGTFTIHQPVAKHFQ
ncbi:hypothetical protein HU200_051930 [Digitaria exilis]|uniref:40S ribosomal protein SA n=1 Tax=Digitaria exilis TaxID=1010633 RepID=A0A835AU36_9POAL|nr:hypothetical protein HU200_051930 [Digitaria exilis]